MSNVQIISLGPSTYVKNIDGNIFVSGFKLSRISVGGKNILYRNPGLQHLVSTGSTVRGSLSQCGVHLSGESLNIDARCCRSLSINGVDVTELLPTMQTFSFRNGLLLVLGLAAAAWFALSMNRS